MSPQIFVDLFAAVASKNIDSLVKVAGSRANDYTTCFGKNIVPELASETGMNLHRESYPARIDYVLSRDASKFHRLDIAIEHEKSGKTAEQEIAKLTLVNSKLAVLVTYIKEPHEELFLPNYLKTISALEMLDFFGKGREFLLILGQHDPWKAIAADNKVGWRFHSLENGAWKQLDARWPPQTAANETLSSAV